VTDLEIIEHLKNNQYSRAVKGLYSIYPSTQKFILLNNGKKEDAEDIFQDALIILYKNVNNPGFTLSASLKTYLLAITKNLWNTAQRKNGKIFFVNEELEIAEGIESNEEPEFKLAELAFTLLGEKCKQLLIAFYYKKESYLQISKSLSFSNENVAKNQKYRCIQKAKENYSNLIKKDFYE
jgi:RNA polymerase sigma factor (sigma-70 family)